MATASDLFKKYELTEETFEMFKGSSNKTGFPVPKAHYRLIMESTTVSVEEAYFWLTTSLRNDASFAQLIKISDVFASSQSSSFFGASQARLGATQDRASGLLAQIGKMVKDLFQIVRELRVLNQKLDYYEKSAKGVTEAEIVLKGIWIDQVEGGTKNPSSVYGMSREVGFVTLPDLFFSLHPKKKEDVQKAITDKYATVVNKKVQEVLLRKLYTYLDWKTRTEEELRTRKNFTLKYLRQHYDIIKMYMDWAKPYLKYTQLLSSKPEMMESADLVSAFEGSLLEVEVLGKKDYSIDKDLVAHSVVSLQFTYRTTPTMPFHQDEYRHKGPLHVGKVEINIRAYAWTPEQMQAYLDLRKDEDLQLLGSINESIKAAMDALGDDLKNYLKEAGEKFDEKKKVEEPKPPKTYGMLDPFISIFKGFGELGKAFLPAKTEDKGPQKPKLHPLEVQSKFDAAAKDSKDAAWNSYKNFKKGHSLMSW